MRGSHTYIQCYIYVNLISSDCLWKVSSLQYASGLSAVMEGKGSRDTDTPILYEGDAVIFYCPEKRGFVYAEPPWWVRSIARAIVATTCTSPWLNPVTIPCIYTYLFVFNKCDCSTDFSYVSLVVPDVRDSDLTNQFSNPLVPNVQCERVNFCPFILARGL